MSYSAFSTKISDYLAEELGLSSEKRVLIAFALDSMLLSLIGFCMILFVGLLFGVPKETFFAVLAGGLLRKVSGGAHFSTPSRCAIMGAVAYPSAGLLVHNTMSYFTGQYITYPALTGMLAVVSFIIISIYAPVDSKAKPIVSDSFRRKLKQSSLVLSIIIILFAIFIDDKSISLALLVGMAIQSISLLPILNHKEVKV